MAFSSKKLVYGKGVKGDGVSRINGKLTKSYDTWHSMLRRCYNPRYQKLQPTYVGCSVCNEWLHFPEFTKWFDENYVEGFSLDKDLLVNGNKEYGPDTCIFVPSQINSLFSDCCKVRGEYPIGVSFNKRNSKFVAHVAIDGKKQHLGCFDNVEDAHNTYIKAKRANVIRVANEWRDKIPAKLYDALLKRAEELT